MEVLSQLLSCHIGKLGRILKVLSESYRKQCSAIELLKMFLQTAGYRHHPQLQFRQQQIAAMSNFHPEASNQFRQLASLQIPQVQTPSMGSVRAPPVKVEGFQELMGGDATLKHDSEENKSTSPPK
ncbi:unnamed protein product [Camellia sinensis]